MIRIKQETCRNLERALSKEWLETNGLGGFASSTIVGLNTRRYHGLLTAATDPPLGRVVMLSKFEETLIVRDRRFDLSTNRYSGAIHPQGFQHLKEFRLDPFPTFLYEVEEYEIRKTIFMVHDENTTVAEYELQGPQSQEISSCILELRPLIAFRDYHQTTHANADLNATVKAAPGLASIEPYDGLPALYFAHDAEEINSQGDWYYNFEYAIERERGLDFQEDLFHPLTLRFDLSRRSFAAVIVSTEPHDIGRAAELRGAELARRAAMAEGSPSQQPLVRALVQAADQFIVRRRELKTVIAGYHWFGDWGRDTMIALPGLTLTTGRTDVAKNILLAFAQHVDQGMLPNRFPDTGEAPEYNTVDAALWFFEAVRALAEKTGEYEFIKTRLYDVLRDMVEWHLRGTRHGIQADADGLLNAGEPGVQLTWMDAKIGDWVVTPRHGKPVEIQALWHNALCILRDFAEFFGYDDHRRRYAEMAQTAHGNFERFFWNESAGCLYDVVSEDIRDGSVRPNQIFAVSLPHSLLGPEKARQVVAVVQRELLTPFGLRTLSPGDRQYQPRYEGGPLSRDGAYHQGTVWPWLLGPFLRAYLRVNDYTPEARKQAAAWLKPLEDHLADACLGQVSEIFDADPPHRPCGCIAQAWSVAELLRVTVEDVSSPTPSFSPNAKDRTRAKGKHKKRATPSRS